MSVVWSSLARDDLIAIQRYIAQFNPAAARAVSARLINAAKLLGERPHLGLRTHREEARRLIVSNSVYSLIYLIRDGDIEIVEVFDGRRRAPRTDLSRDV
ncbi:type II toxin-antitoxin system RelE/ParE family toxin [Rhizobium metallidurans]|uniref:Toxin ParE1/3/4 n=1 Tax=Rhizobium metallidurans TaxID=1265931 RepID=A0A7W6CYE3_9HYPH|nr:type II toxin-antitoxin system RelE/ParE family toxin [Rhizobium metallidurans]MBB3964776.1 toxin ParE1/3/4 [Rhizobium metallidurans]